MRRHKHFIMNTLTCLVVVHLHADPVILDHNLPLVTPAPPGGGRVAGLLWREKKEAQVMTAQEKNYLSSKLFLVSTIFCSSRFTFCISLYQRWRYKGQWTGLVRKRWWGGKGRQYAVYGMGWSWWCSSSLHSHHHQEYIKGHFTSMTSSPQVRL